MGKSMGRAGVVAQALNLDFIVTTVSQVLPFYPLATVPSEKHIKYVHRSRQWGSSRQKGDLFR
jgi:hypothetical protein